MIKVSDIVGSMVRSVTMARIQSDIISSQASLEYLKDPVLRAFPVPRAEIQKADITLKLAVTDVAQESPDENTVSQKALSDAVPGYVDRVFALQAFSNPPTRLSEAVGAKLPTFKAIVGEFLNARIAEDVAGWTDLAKKNPGEFAVKMSEHTMAALNDARAKLNPKLFWEDQLNQLVYGEAKAWASGAASAQKLAADVAGTAGFELDLAVKREDVTQLPEHLVSEIRLSVVVDNYEWTQVTDANGNIINRLNHK